MRLSLGQSGFRRIGFAVLCSTLFSASASAAQLYDDSFAVVVGIDLYSSTAWPDLDYPTAEP